jgi:hypothetical protein
MTHGKMHSIDRQQDERGFVLLVVLFALTVLGIMATLSLAVSSAERSAANGVREGTKAFSAAESGLEFLVATWDVLQLDTLMPSPGDSLDLGWQTLANGCSQRVRVRRVDGGTGPMLFSARSTGRGVGENAGTRELGMLISKGAGDWPDGAMLIGGDVTVSSQPAVTGDCGSLYASGNVTDNTTSSDPGNDFWGGETDDGSSYPDSDMPSGDLSTSPWDTPGAYGDTVALPDMDPLDYCPSDADFMIRDQWFITMGPPRDSVLVDGSSSSQGWRWNSSENQYELGDYGTPQSGTLCVFGNAEISGQIGRDGDPINMSLITTGSASVTGNSFINADHPDGIGILAGGDVELSGNGGIVSDNVDGLIYAGSQCSVNGEVHIKGQMICRDAPNPYGSKDLEPYRNDINGSLKIEAVCEAPWMDRGLARIPGTWNAIFD